MAATASDRVGVSVDGRTAEVPRGMTVLEAARQMGVSIPTLCNYRGLSPYGACRFCLVELEAPRGGQLVASCSHPVESGMVVRTETESVKEARRTVLELLLAQAQASPRVPVIDRESCIHFKTGQCGLCAKVCQAGAIDYDQPRQTLRLEVGAVVLTPGFEAFDATRRGAFGFGFAPNVLTNVQFERLLSASGPTQGHVLRPSDGKPPRRLAFLQCVGSRDTGCDNDYCSSVCCMAATKEAILAKQHEPGLDATIFFLDLRAFGKDFDRYCDRAKNQLGVRYVRSFISRTYEMPGTRNLRVVYAAAPEKEKGIGPIRAKPGTDRRLVAGRPGKLDLSPFSVGSPDPSGVLLGARRRIFRCQRATGKVGHSRGG